MSDRTDREAMRGGLTLKRIPPSSDVAWNKAMRVPWISLSAAEQAGGWPDAFSPENLARLQYPYEGTDPEKKRARRDQQALLAALRTMIEADSLPTVTCTRIEAITENKNVPDLDAPRRTWVREYPGDFPRLPLKRITITTGERPVQFVAIERAAFRDFLKNQGIKPSEHIRAWLGSIRDRSKKPDQALHKDESYKADFQNRCREEWQKEPLMRVEGENGIVETVGKPFLHHYARSTLVRWAKKVAPEGVKGVHGRPKKTEVDDKN